MSSTPYHKQLLIVSSAYPCPPPRWLSFGRRGTIDVSCHLLIILPNKLYLQTNKTRPQSGFILSNHIGEGRNTVSLQ